MTDNQLQTYTSPPLFFMQQAQRTLCRTDLDRDNQVNLAYRYVHSAIGAFDQARLAGPVPLFFWLGMAGEVSPSAASRINRLDDNGEVY